MAKKEKKEHILMAQHKSHISGIMKYSKLSKYGLTTEELRQYFADLVMLYFGNYIDGQTTALVAGKSVIYPEDISRFVAGIQFPGPSFWD